jgi:concanavalin A-like lectin/glucanase superfamily protein/type IX secretion system substrate protein
VPGWGNYIAPFSALSLSGGGQFDSCIVGSEIAGGGIITGWPFRLRGNSWTISMWLSIPTTTSGSAFYLFGDTGAGAFRCYHNGSAGPNNLVLRGNFNDVIVPDIGPAPTVVTFVYDSAAGNIKAYKNGVLAIVSNQTLNIPLGTGFKAGGYGSMQTFVGKIDEFRVYWSALIASDVQFLYNYNIPVNCPFIGINNLNNEIPGNYLLKQNYPNPFNPLTQISFGIPMDGLTKLVIYDILGKEIYTLVYSYLKAGYYGVSFNAENIASGTYFYILASRDFKATKKMVIIK